MPSPSEVAAFSALMAKIAGMASEKAADVVAAAPDRDVLRDAYPDIIDPYLQASAQVTEEWYHSMAPDSGYAVEAAPPISRDALRANAGWAVTQLDAVGALTGSAERQVYNASRQTVVHNAQREGVTYAREARATACGFCKMLATRGPVYASKSAASGVAGKRGTPRGKAKLGGKYHDNCHCVAVPVRVGDSYQPPDYAKDWEQEYINARNEVGGNPDDIANRMRPSQAGKAVVLDAQ